MEIFDVFDIRKKIIRLNHFCIICERKINYRSNICHNCRLKIRWDKPTPKMIQQIRIAGEIAHSRPRSERQLEQFEEIRERGNIIAHANASKRMIGNIGYWKDKHLSDDHKIKISESHKGKKAYQWLGGISFEPYCYKFNFDLKERVREFFNRKCYVCDMTEEENGRRLDVHHVNYDKMICCNDIKPLFVPLCRRHNTVANFNREEWEEFFIISLEYLTDGKCFYIEEEMNKINIKDISNDHRK